MKETIDKVMAWAKGNPMLAAGAGLLALVVLAPKVFKTVRRRRRRVSRPIIVRYRRGKTVRKSKPRRRSYSRGGAKKKPWQIKGSLAARRHMAQLRKMR